MHHFTVAVVLMALTVARAEAGGIDYEIRAGLVHEVEADATKIVFTVSGPCAIYLQAPDREDKANRVDTALKGCAVTITKEAFEKWARGTQMTWAEYQASAKRLAGKTAFIQLSGIATVANNRITSIHGAGPFRPERKTLQKLRIVTRGPVLASRPGRNCRTCDRNLPSPLVCIFSLGDFPKEKMHTPASPRHSGHVGPSATAD